MRVIRKMHVKKFVPRKIFVRDYSNYNKGAFKFQLRNIPWENCLKHPDINSAWNSSKITLKVSSWKRKSVDES